MNMLRPIRDNYRDTAIVLSQMADVLRIDPSPETVSTVAQHLDIIAQGFRKGVMQFDELTPCDH